MSPAEFSPLEKTPTTRTTSVPASPCLPRPPSVSCLPSSSPSQQLFSSHSQSNGLFGTRRLPRSRLEAVMHWDPLPQSTDVPSRMERCQQLLVQVQRNPRILKLLHLPPTLPLLPRLEDSLRMSIRTQCYPQPRPPSPTQRSEPVSPLLHLFTSLLLLTPTVDTTPIHRLETADM